MKRLDLVFLWHMHQPDYRDHASGEVVLPWTLLHALKDYTDMAAHLERHPAIRAVVNFVPVLLDQIDDYVAQCTSGQYRDPLLRWLAAEDLGSLAGEERAALLEACFRCHAPTMRAPFPDYERLHVLYQALTDAGPAALAYLSGAYLSDLVTWYCLAWTGETERRRVPLLAELMAKGAGFTAGDRRALLAYVGDTLAALVPRYRALQDRGQVELSTTPYSHPLSPLLLDFAVTREALPEAPLPQSEHFPGGRARVMRHLEQARSRHAERFGRPAAGLWPAEGAVSEAFVGLAAQAGFRWLATGENVLHNSLGMKRPGDAAHPWALAGTPGMRIFFRDDGLSDQIGFEYARWHGRDAATHLVAQLEAIAAAAPEGETPVVSIILDGENAWEFYPYNGFHFFEDLYGLLEQHPTLRTRSFSDVLGDGTVPPAPVLPRLVAGSWVYGSFSTWIGEQAKNHAWDLLCVAKQCYDRVIASERLSAAEAQAAEAQLAVCEGSDWFWWFGDHNPAASVSDFDRLFRRNLANLYRRLKLDPPTQLDVPICHGDAAGTAEAGGTMRRAGGQGT